MSRDQAVQVLIAGHEEGRLTCDQELTLFNYLIEQKLLDKLPIHYHNRVLQLGRLGLLNYQTS